MNQLSLSKLSTINVANVNQVLEGGSAAPLNVQNNEPGMYLQSDDQQVKALQEQNKYLGCDFEGRKLEDTKQISIEWTSNMILKSTLIPVKFLQPGTQSRYSSCISVSFACVDYISPNIFKSSGEPQMTGSDSWSTAWCSMDRLIARCPYSRL